MTQMEKIVFSRTLKSVSWANTTLLSKDIATEVRRLKAGSGPDMVILGSGTIVAQLTEADLIDEYRIVHSAIVLGAGRSLFEGVTRKISLDLQRTRAFSNGNVVSWYKSPKSEHLLDDKNGA
jgi:dihydrofolate reductase